MARRGETPGPVEVRHPGFGGLDLSDAPRGSRPNGAQEAVDIVLAGVDQIRPRRGSERWADPSILDGAALPIDLFAFNIQNLPIVMWGTEEGLGFMAGGVEGAHNSTIATPRTWYDFARVGSPAVQTVFVGGQGSFPVNGMVVRRYRLGLGFDSPAVSISGAAAAGDMGRACVLGVWGPDARLLMGGYSGTSPSGPNGLSVDQDTIVVSNPGDPTAFGTAVNPGLPIFRVGAGDGESVMGIVEFRDMAFIFKESRAWVLTGISAGPTGAPEFHRRPFDIGYCGVPLGPGAMGAARDGVYFVTRRGVYRASGNGAPVSVSDDIESLFSAGTLTDDWSKVRLAVDGPLVIVTYPRPVLGSSGGRRGQLVYDIDRKEWVNWELCAAAFGASDDKLYFVDTGRDVVTGDTGFKPALWVMANQETDYEGSSGWSNMQQTPTRPMPVWRSVDQDFGSTAMKYIHQTKIWAEWQPTATSGQKKLEVFTDYGNGGGQDLPGEGTVRHGYKGTRFSFRLSGRLRRITGMTHLISGQGVGDGIESDGGNSS